MITRTSAVRWIVQPDRSILLSVHARPAAVIWPDGLRWRVATADDGHPGDRHPTLDEAKAAAMIIARNWTPAPDEARAEARR